MNNNLTDNKEFNEALIRRQIELYSGIRKNFSEESEKIMDKVRREMNYLNLMFLL